MISRHCKFADNLKAQINFFSGTRQNVWHDKNIFGQLIITVRQNVWHNKHSIGEKNNNFCWFLEHKKNQLKNFKKKKNS